MNLKTLDHHLETVRRIPIEKLCSEARYWLKTCQGNPAGPDGYPTSASGADRTLGTGSRATRDRRELDDLITDPADEHLDDHNRPTHELSHLPASASTSVETAATAEKRARDDIDMKTNVALGNIATAAHALEVAMAKFVECRNLQKTGHGDPKPECWIMRARADVFEESAHKSDLNGLLDEPRHVSAWVYKFARANEILPTREQCRAHARGERVMMAA